jgi:alkylhydroperoxidase family enzyme
MSTPRIVPIEPPYSESLRSAFEQAVPPPAPPLKLYRSVARNPDLFQALTGGGLLGPRGLLHLGSMAAADRELIILRTTARTRAAYEWEVHALYFGRRNGLSSDQMQATCRAVVDPVLWNVRQVAIIALIDRVVDHAALQDDVWRAISDELSEEDIIEMTALAGLYATVAMLVNVIQPEREAGAPEFPGWSEG